MRDQSPGTLFFTLVRLTTLRLTLCRYAKAVAKGVPRHTPGVRFAINIDPAQFLVYTAAATGNALSAAVPRGAYDGPSFASSLPVSTVVSATASATTTVVTLLTAMSPSASFVSLTTLTAPLAFAGVAPSPFMRVAPAVAVATAVASTPVVITANASAVVACTVTASSLQPLGSAAAPGPAGTRLLDVSGILNDPPRAAWSDCRLVWATAAANGTGHVAVSMRWANGSSIPSAPTTFVAPPDASGIRRVSVAAAAVSGAVLAVVEVSTATAVLSVLVTIDGAGAHVQRRPVHVGTGSSVSLAASPSSGAVIVARTWTDGFCPNSENHNKNADVAVCDHPPTQTPGVMEYETLRLDDARVWLHAPPSPCSNVSLQGSFGSGTHPSVALTPVGARGDVAVVVAHGGWTNTTDVGQCGLPTPVAGPVVDAWRLPLSTWN